IERADAVRQARQIGVEGNMHDASGCGAFTIEGIELPAYRVLEISRGHIGALEGLLVINVIAVRQCRDCLVSAERHRVGLIVVGPQSATYSQPASPKRSSVFQVSCSPAPSQPTGRAPLTLAMVSSVSRMIVGSSSAGTSLRRRELLWLCPIHSQ